MDANGNGKYLIAVALIGALATVMVALIPYWLSHNNRSALPSKESPAPATVVDHPSLTMPVPVGPVSKPKPQLRQPFTTKPESTAALVSLVREYLRAGKDKEAIAPLKQLIGSDPTKSSFHACLAELSINQGNFQQAREQFDRAAQLGETGLADASAQVAANEDVLAAAQQFPRGADATDQDWETYTRLIIAKIPGTEAITEKLCTAIVFKIRLIDPETDPSSYRKWVARRNVCAGEANTPPGNVDCQ